MESEDQEQEILLDSENIILSAGGAVNSVNGYTGDVVLKTSDLENNSNYQNGDDVASAISTHNESDSAHSDIRQSVIDEATNRENADIALQGQIDALIVASDVVDIVGTYADLENYDTQHLKDNDIIKVLQDSTHSNAMSYYRWVASTTSWVYVGSEGPYYTKSEADTEFVPQTRKVNDKALSSDISLTASDVSAISTSDIEQSTGSSAIKVMSQDAITTALSNKQNTLSAGANISIDANNEISATDTTYSNFTGTDGVSAGTTGLVPAPATTDAGKFLKADGTWATAGGGGGVTVVQTTGTSQTDVMSQNATTSMICSDPSTVRRIRIGDGATASHNGTVAIGRNAKASYTNAVAVGYGAKAEDNNSVSVGYSAVCPGSYQVALGSQAGANTPGNLTNTVALGSYSKATRTGEVNVGTPNSSGAGYNSTAYRVIGGVYDGQDSHDAVTVGQVNGVIDAINAALNINISHIGS